MCNYTIIRDIPDKKGAAINAKGKSWTTGPSPTLGMLLKETLRYLALAGFLNTMTNEEPGSTFHNVCYFFKTFTLKYTNQQTTDHMFC